MPKIIVIELCMSRS